MTDPRADFRLLLENPAVRVDPDVLLRTCAASGADLLVCVDSTGEEIPGIGVVRRSPGEGPGNLPALPATRRNAYPFLLAGDAAYSTERQREEAEKYRDRIADRLFRPECVPDDKKVLIQDDLARIERVLSLPFGRRVLEVGCSDGAVSVLIARKPEVASVLGVDILETAIADARDLAAREPEEVRRKLSFRASPLEDLHPAPGSFDTACAFETLEHLGIGQVKPALATLARALAPGGSILLTVPNRWPAEHYVREGRARWKWENHTHFFSPVSLRYLLGEFFPRVVLHPLREGEGVEEGIYLIAECQSPGTGGRPR